eukprot:3615373-Prymnesium_polylepis.1
MHISRGRRTANVRGTHAPMHPRSADMRATLTAEPRAPRKLIGGRSAHARGLGGTLHLSSSLPTSLSQRCAEDEGTCCCCTRRRQLVADGFVQLAVDRGCTNRVAESRRGRSAACE